MRIQMNDAHEHYGRGGHRSLFLSSCGQEFEREHSLLRMEKYI